MKTNVENNSNDYDKNPKPPIGRYIILAIFILMVLFYLAYINGYVAD